MIAIPSIIQVVTTHYGISEDDLRSPRRHARIVRARHVAMYLARHMTAHSFPQIAQEFGANDHTTIMYAVRKIAWELSDDPALVLRLAALRAKLLGEFAQCA